MTVAGQLPGGINEDWHGELQACSDVPASCSSSVFPKHSSRQGMRHSGKNSR
jgi:hypothetical protein